MSYDDGLIEFIVDTLHDASPRFEETPVRIAYDALAAAIETQGNGAFYEGQPLTPMQLSLLRIGLRGADDLMPIVAMAIELGAVLAQPAVVPAPPAGAAPEPEPPIPGEGTIDHRPAQPLASPSVEAGLPEQSPQSSTAAAAAPPQMQGSVSIFQQVGSANNTTISMVGYSQTAPSDEPLPSIHDSAAFALPPIGAEAESAAAGTEHYDAFLSYSHRDGAIMRRLFKDLRRAGISVWTDEHLALGTRSWLEAVENAIRASTVLLVLLTPNAKASKFVETEIITAQNYKIPVIPMLAVGDEKTAVPILLQNVQWGDIRSEVLYRKNTLKLIQRLRSIRKKAY